MPPKADYWKYFNIVGVVAFCLIAQCKHPKSPLALLPSLARRRESEYEYDVKGLYICTCVLGVTAITNHLSRHHNDIWEAYVLARDAKRTAQANIKKEEVLNCKMENAELRFTDMRSNAGQLAFLNQVLFIAWF